MSHQSSVHIWFAYVRVKLGLLVSHLPNGQFITSLLEKVLVISTIVPEVRVRKLVMCKRGIGTNNLKHIILVQTAMLSKEK